MRRIRRAIAGDAQQVLTFIRGLAEYERLLDQVAATAEGLDRDLFCANPRAFCDFVEVDGVPVGFAVWYYSFSTFQGRHGIYLQDLYVEPSARGGGHGKALLQHLAGICQREGLGRLDWQVLDWNAPSIAFYEAMGARIMHEWKNCRVDGPALEALAR
ncbi:Ribosomal protein S18 acetylase RimI [Devosia enhydra]|uniref:Ribosomal protein S18 acetylase RimI n=1 Tax=Devosia enhydra TaxID=665118 RepID=A0A1K2HVP2_9HYPH|nr:GNAT family N-acetyltransferase [Devosia enhydra]SFZ82809.1 Ribosomal protein S18 acetylase RimI [Devosia enhydra]